MGRPGSRCDGCGLTDLELPDLVDPDLFFATIEDRILCDTCQAAPPHLRAVV